MKTRLQEPTKTLDLELDSTKSVQGILKEHIIWPVWVLVGFVYALSLAPGDLGHDAARYVMLAKPIASSQGYRALNLPGNPPFTLYPPGFPTLLAPVFFIFPEIPADLAMLQLAPALTGWLAVPIVYFTLRNLVRADSVLSAVIALVFSLLYSVMNFSLRFILSEGPYTFLSFAALLLLARYGTTDGLERKGEANGRFFVATALIVASYLVRQVGLTLFVATVVYFLLRRDYRRALLIAVLFVVLIAPWAWRNLSVGSGLLGSSGYYNNFLLRDFGQPHLGRIAGVRELASRLMSNVWGHATQTILELLVPTLRAGRSVVVVFIERMGLNWAVDLTGLGLLSLTLVGFAASLRRQVELFDLYTFFYVGMILLPPWYTVRNLVPIAPLILYYLVLGVRTIVARLPLPQQPSRTISIYAVFALLSLILASNLFSDRHHLFDAAAYRAGLVNEREAAFQDVSRWMKNHLSPDALLMSNFPEKLFLYSDRKTLQVPPLAGDELISFLGENGVDFVVIELPIFGGRYDRGDELYLWPTIEGHPEAFTPIYETPGQPRFVVYQVSAGS